VGDGEAGERARLAAVDRGPLVHARRAAWLELARSPRLRVREAALKAIGAHPELGDAAGAVLASALSDERAGVVTTAADVVRAHPDRVAPPPKGAPARAAPEPDAALAQAVRGALARPWPPADIETRAALIDAALALRLVDEGRAAAQSACADPNAALRARAAAALASLGAAGVHCDAPPGGAPAPEVGAEVSGGTRLAFETDAGALAIRLDPAFAPVAVARVAALARAGFYDGLVFHRVVPGFVAQFGDPDGDGFGGGRDLLRCETAPVPFGALDVGVALAGRDTGSSQLFVTQARYPQLDGATTWVGRAEGDWSSVIEGDAIRAVHVE
jgi:cyclophilin family peptidyl-prolyl cis-trans isomerase